MVQGRPDRERFRAMIDDVLGPPGAGGRPRMQLIGEMVDLLARDGDLAPVIALPSRGWPLLCAADRQAIVRCHSHLLFPDDDRWFQDAARRGAG